MIKKDKWKLWIVVDVRFIEVYRSTSSALHTTGITIEKQTRKTLRSFTFCILFSDRIIAFQMFSIWIIHSTKTVESRVFFFFSRSYESHNTETEWWIIVTTVPDVTIQKFTMEKSRRKCKLFSYQNVRWIRQKCYKNTLTAKQNRFYSKCQPPICISSSSLYYQTIKNARK